MGLFCTGFEHLTYTPLIYNHKPLHHARTQLLSGNDFIDDDFTRLVEACLQPLPQNRPPNSLSSPHTRAKLRLDPQRDQLSGPTAVDFASLPRRCLHSHPHAPSLAHALRLDPHRTHLAKGM